MIDALQVSQDFSGVGREVIELGRDLAQLQDAPGFTVRCSAEMEPTFRRAFPEGTRFETPLRTGRPRWLRILYQQLVAPLRDDRGTVLICIGDQGPIWGRAAVICVINDVRRLTLPWTADGFFERTYYRIVVRRAARRAVRLLTISEYSRGEIQRVLKPTAPVELINIRPTGPSTSNGHVQKAGPLLVVGAVRPYKGLDALVEALGLLAGRTGGSAPEVFCVGPLSRNPAFADRLKERAAQLGVNESFHLLGWRDEDELERLYGDAIATVNPSTYEGYGLSVADSLARGIPTIASDIPSHREISGDAAVLFQPGKPDALADAIESVIADRDRRRELAARGRERWISLGNGGRTWGPAITDAVRSMGGPPA